MAVGMDFKSSPNDILLAFGFMITICRHSWSHCTLPRTNFVAYIYTLHEVVKLARFRPLQSLEVSRTLQSLPRFFLSQVFGCYWIQMNKGLHHPGFFLSQVFGCHWGFDQFLFVKSCFEPRRIHSSLDKTYMCLTLKTHHLNF